MSSVKSKTGAMTAALLAGVLATSLQASAVLAQDAPPPPPPPAEAPPPPPPPVAPPAPVVTATPAPEATPTVAATPEKKGFKKMDPPGIWFRLDNQIRSKDPMNAKKLNGFVMGSEVDVLFSGQVHEYVAWQADFVGTFGNAVAKDGDPALDASMTGQAAILDLIGKFQLHESFNIWVGRMLVPSDRSNFSGPWFMSAWNYPNFFGGVNANPKQGPFGRNNGATVWGQFLGGHVKYYASAFDLYSVGTKALYSGRLNLTLLNPEPGYYHSSTYYGGKDIVALGVGGQFKKDGSTPMGAATDDYSLFNVDLLAEKTLGGAGTATFEAAFYKFDGNAEPVKHNYYLLASYLIPAEIWVGKLQPLVRFQQAAPKGGGKKLNLIDAALSYVVDEYAMRIALNYQNADLGGVKANAISIGVQIQK
jgi:hypothetical protein